MYSLQKNKIMVKGCAFLFMGLMLIMALPVCLGLAGGLFGMIIGLVGGLFGIIAGIFGAVIGIVGAIIKGFFHLLFGWGVDYDGMTCSGGSGLWVVVIVLVVVTLAFRQKGKS